MKDKNSQFLTESEIISLAQETARALCGLRIVSGNCHYGFDGKKSEAIKKYGADILVIPECREMDMKGSGYNEQHRDWYGDHKEATDTLGNINKEKGLGIGVFWKDGINMEQLIIPISLSFLTNAE